MKVNLFATLVVTTLEISLKIKIINAPSYYDSKAVIIGVKVVLFRELLLLLFSADMCTTCTCVTD